VGVDGLILESLASAEAVLSEDERQAGVILADIGAATTDIALFTDGSVCHTATLPVGGNHVTHDITVGLGVPFHVAEALKKKFGDVAPTKREVENDVAVEDNGHSVSYSDLCEIASARMEEILRLIISQLPPADYGKLAPNGLVITGGSSNLAGIAELGRRATRLPVRVGTVLNINGSNQSLSDPTYATGVGLLFWRLSNANLNDWRERIGSLRVWWPRFLKYFNN
jgi:cell division protein FtsA